MTKFYHFKYFKTSPEIIKLAVHGLPRKIVTDKLLSYKAEMKTLNIQHLQDTGRYKNNQVEKSRLHFR